MHCRHHVLLLLAMLALAQGAHAHEFSNKGVTIAHPWVRATPEGVAVGAAFLEIKTDDKTADKLIAITTPVAGRGEIHTHIVEGDVLKMRRIESLELKPGTALVLKPMGDHIMLMELKNPLKEGDLVKLTLEFEKAGKIEVEATVEPIGAKGPHGMDHQPGHEGHDEGGSKSGGSAGADSAHEGDHSEHSHH